MEETEEERPPAPPLIIIYLTLLRYFYFVSTNLTVLQARNNEGKHFVLDHLVSQKRKTLNGLKFEKPN